MYQPVQVFPAGGLVHAARWGTPVIAGSVRTLCGARGNVVRTDPAPTVSCTACARIIDATDHEAMAQAHPGVRP